MAVDTKARSKAFLKSITIPPIDIRTSPREMLDERTKGSESLGLGQQIIPVDSTLRSAATEGLGNLLGGGRERYQSAQNVMSVLDALPYAGGMLMTDDVNTEYQQGNYKTAAALGALGVLPFGKQIADVGRGAIDSAGRLVNQTVANTPTLIEGFYSGKPWNFLKDAAAEIPDAIKTRTNAFQRAYQELWGLSDIKTRDVFNNSKTAERMLKRGTPKDKAAAKKSGQDSQLTAMNIEAQMSPTIIPKDERGLLANSVFGLDFWDVGIDASDTVRLANSIGNGNRLPDAGTIPDNIVTKFMGQLLNGPHVKSGSNTLYEYQVKTLDASRTRGQTESVGALGKGAPLLRAFNVSKTDAENAITPFQAYSKLVNKEGNLSPIDTVEFTQLATTLDKDATKVINDLLPRRLNAEGKMVKAPILETAVLLEKISKARHYQRIGKKLKKGQQDALTAFNEAVSIGNVKLRAVKDEAGNVVSHLDYDKIQKPKGYISAQQSHHSEQKELGGVNQMLIVDPYNQVNYSMLSDGHDIYGWNPVGGHGLVTAQPIVMQPWSRLGYVPQHNTNTTREQVSETVQRVEAATGQKAPTSVSNATGADYLYKAKNWTKGQMLKAVNPSDETIKAASRTQNKVTGAKAAGSVALGAGLLTGYNAAQADTPSKVWKAPAPAPVFETRTDTKPQAAPVVAKPTPPQKKTQQVFGQGDTKTIQRDGKSVANVSRQQLQETGLSLRDYLNTWNKTGDRP